jgi:hypothetical protein
LDLDDSILQTRRKKDGDKLIPAAFGKDGEPLSFMTPAQAFLVETLSRDFDLIPVTARNRDSFLRVKISFKHGAILNFGGTILKPSGETDKAWLNQISPKAGKANSLLQDALSAGNRLKEEKKLKAKLRIIGDDGLSFYLVAKTEHDRLDELSYLKKELEKDFSSEAIVFLNGNNLSLMPKYLDKGPATEYFIKTYLLSGAAERDELIILGLGDSFSDAGFLALCDYQIIPQGSQLGSLIRPK